MNAPTPAGGSATRRMSPSCTPWHFILPPKMERWNRNQCANIICLQIPHLLSFAGLHSVHKPGIGLNRWKRGKKTNETPLMRVDSSEFTQTDLSRQKLAAQSYRNSTKIEKDCTNLHFLWTRKGLGQASPSSAELWGSDQRQRVPNNGKCFFCGTKAKLRRPHGLFHQPQSTCQPGEECPVLGNMFLEAHKEFWKAGNYLEKCKNRRK